MEIDGGSGKFVEYCFKKFIKDELAFWDYYRFDYSEGSIPKLTIDYHIWEEFSDSPRKDYIEKTLNLTSEEISNFWKEYKNFGS